MILLLLSCVGTKPPADVPTEDTLVPLEAGRLLRRMSLDLRGVTPSTEELAAVEADPAALDRYRDAFLDDPRLEGRLLAFWAERYRTRIDEFQVRYYDYQLPAEQECDFELSVGEEPLRLVAHVTMEDRPWSEVVTADYTMANELLGGLWPIEYPEGATGWQESTYTDGRPANGVLSTNGLWLRYYTSQSNANRSRAAALADLLLCVDYLERPVSFSSSPSLVDTDATATALRTDDACLACHASIEPLAATLFGYYPAIDYNRLELVNYHPERESLGPELLGVPMGYFGIPLESPSDLGPQIAADPRFYTCAVETMAGMLWRRTVAVDEYATIAALEEEFAAGDWRARSLLRAVTDTPQYRAGTLAESADATVEARERTVRMLGPDALASAVSDLTGFTWRYNGCDQLGNDDYGYRVLAGGVDGEQVTRSQQDPSLTWALVVQRLAQGGAVTAVQRELVEGGERRLFAVTLDTLPTDPAFTEQLDTLYLRLFARRPTAEERAADIATWEAAGDPMTGWTALLTILLRDPEFVTG
ncbi:MAG: hypothetical protein Q8P18_19230 [Pseudomonadota bacterium]|nr:hypothetical protein [Pseudomonadota bacterium]